MEHWLDNWRPPEDRPALTKPHQPRRKTKHLRQQACRVPCIEQGLDACHSRSVLNKPDHLGFAYRRKLYRPSIAALSCHWALSQNPPDRHHPRYSKSLSTYKYPMSRKPLIRAKKNYIGIERRRSASSEWNGIERRSQDRRQENHINRRGQAPIIITL